MQIGEFVARLQTSKETVRHYEDLLLLTPARQNNRRIALRLRRERLEEQLEQVSKVLG